MTVFACLACAAPLTAEVRRAKPARDAGQRDRRGIAKPVMVRGTFMTVEAPDRFVLHPDDLPGTAPHPDEDRLNGCCRLDGLDGPNLVCAACGAEVGTRESDCWTRNQVLLDASAVRGPSG
ncbi:hypothetical protein ACIA8O_12755 [Kitasatospora sp. NPDC051853]|uniref:hypothetical protein n=1 Tax=Kitasatospora sp. NPDC051853 TaxID=3364058 RepID=UPI0037BC7346